MVMAQASLRGNLRHEPALPGLVRATRLPAMPADRGRRPAIEDDPHGALRIGIDRDDGSQRPVRISAVEVVRQRHDACADLEPHDVIRDLVALPGVAGKLGLERVLLAVERG